MEVYCTELQNKSGIYCESGFRIENKNGLQGENTKQICHLVAIKLAQAIS
jgi:hypothetical protein